MKEYGSKLNNNIKSCVKCICIIVLIFISVILFGLVLYFIEGHSNIICELIYDAINNKSVIGWFSGFGSLSAVIIALWVAIPPEDKYVSSIECKGYYDSQHETLVIQLVNSSEAFDFIKLYNIGFSNKINSIQNNVPFPDNLRCYEYFHKIYGRNIFTIKMPKNSLKLPDKRLLFDEFLNSNKKYLVFVFKDFSNKSKYLTLSQVEIRHMNKEYEDYQKKH